MCTPWHNIPFPWFFLRAWALDNNFTRSTLNFPLSSHDTKRIFRCFASTVPTNSKKNYSSFIWYILKNHISCPPSLRRKAIMQTFNIRITVEYPFFQRSKLPISQRCLFTDGWRQSTMNKSMELVRIIPSLHHLHWCLVFFHVFVSFPLYLHLHAPLSKPPVTSSFYFYCLFNICTRKTPSSQTMHIIKPRDSTHFKLKYIENTLYAYA